jgi:beta-1,4-N-acetylglucosaminyltransferase
MRVCFVTTGATAPFTGLIEAVLQPSFVEALTKCGYTHLLVQYGTAKAVFEKGVRNTRPQIQEDFVIGGIAFDPDGLTTQFKLVQDSKGLVISHAGTNLAYVTSLRLNNSKDQVRF